MALDPSIALQVHPSQAISPQQLISLKNLQRQGQIQELQLQEATRQIKNRNAMLGITSNPQNFDQATGTLTPGAIQQIGGIDPGEMFQAGEQRRVALAQLAVEQQRKAAMVEKKASAAKEMLPAVVNAYDLALERTNGNQQEAMRAAAEARGQWIDDLEKSGRAAALGFTPEEIQKERADPINIERFRALSSTPQEIVSRTAPQTNVGKADRDYKLGKISKEEHDKLVAKETSPTSQMLIQDIPISDEDKQYWADVIRRGGSFPPGLARSAAGAKLVAEVMKEVPKGSKPAELLANQAELAGTKAAERTAATRGASIEMAGSEAASLADLAKASSEKVSRTSYKSLNDVLQAAQRAGSAPELRAFVAANTSLINAYARAINPTGVGTVADKEHAREMLSTAFSKGDYNAVVDQLLKEIDAAKQSPKTVTKELRKRVTGEGDHPSDIQDLLKKYAR